MTEPAAKNAPAKKPAAKKARTKSEPAKNPPAKKPADTKTPAKKPAVTKALPPQRLTGWEFATWRAGTDDPVLRSPIIGLILLDTAPDWNQLVERFDRASRMAPVLRQKVVSGPVDSMTPRLVVDPDFDLSFHLRRFRLSLPGNWDQVLDEVRRQSMTDFDLHRPLWRVTLLEGLEGDKSALLIKLNHTIADGQGAMLLGATLFDFSECGVDLGPMPAEPVGDQLDHVGMVSHAMREATSRVARTARDAVEAAGPVVGRLLSNPSEALDEVGAMLRSVGKLLTFPTRPLSKTMSGRSLNYHFSTFDVPLAELKLAGKSRGLSLNDAFMAAITAGLRLYHEANGETVDTLRVNMPISLRSPENGSSNSVTIARFEVPVGEVDLDIRMRAIHEIAQQWRKEPALAMTDALAEMSRFVPVELLAAAAQTSDFTASNVAGVPMPVWLAGAKVLRMYPMVATIGAAANITLLSYVGVASIGVSTDDAAIADYALFAKCLGDGFTEVLGHPVSPAMPLNFDALAVTGQQVSDPARRKPAPSANR